jgi:hypothetical protein
MRSRTDRILECAAGRHGREGHTLALTSDSHRALDHGHPPREDRKIRERLRKCTGERGSVEPPFKEEDNVDRQVGNHGIADVATDFEPFGI